jgi:hypothetical protein
MVVIENGFVNPSQSLIYRISCYLITGKLQMTLEACDSGENRLRNSGRLKSGVTSDVVNDQLEIFQVVPDNSKKICNLYHV